jgi:hypothetical protein
MMDRGLQTMGFQIAGPLDQIDAVRITLDRG